MSAVKIVPGYTYKSEIEVVLYVPGLVDEETKELTTPIGGDKTPFTLLMQSKKTDAMKKAADAYKDAAAMWHKEKNTPKKLQTLEHIAKIDPDYHMTMVEDYVMSGVLGWKNAPAVNEAGERLASAPYEAAALRELFRSDRDLLFQALSTYDVKNEGKFVSLSA